MQRFKLFLQTVSLGVRNIRSNKLRSGLTVLGIVFGVCSVISMLAITEGASAEAQDQIKRLGSQNIIVRTIKPPKDQLVNPRKTGWQANFIDYGLRYSDAEVLSDTMPWVEVVVPVKSWPNKVRFKAREMRANVIGTVPWYPDSNPIQIIRGRFLTKIDLERTGAVCVIGQQMAQQLFLFRDPMNQTLTIGENAFRIVGIVETGGGGGEGGQDLPSQTAEIFVPLTTMRALQGDLFMERGSGTYQSEYVELHELILRLKDQDDVLRTSEIVESTLAARHDKDDFESIVPLRLLAQARETQRIFSIVFGSIAAIALLVGGIGIMNIMLASVSERTREIGIRRALGARRSDIMTQFLVETIILSVGGGILGMMLGALIPWITTRISGMNTVLTVMPFVLSFVVSVMIGIVFGLYPARRAAVMDPIDALRHE